jgi:hypothetical protein
MDGPVVASQIRNFRIEYGISAQADCGCLDAYLPNFLAVYEKTMLK